MNKKYYHRFQLAGLLLSWTVFSLAACAVTPGEPAAVVPPASTEIAAAAPQPAGPATAPAGPTATATPVLAAASPTAPPAETGAAVMAQAAAPEEAAAVPFTTIAQGALLGAEPAEPLYAVLEPAEWNELLALLPQSLSQAGVPTGDGETLIVVAVAGQKDSSGYELTIDRITRSGAQLSVVVAETGPEPDQIVEPATTVPYHIVAIDQSALADAAAGRVVFLDTAGNVLMEEDF